MGARGPRTLDPLSLGSQPSGVTRVTRLVTRCVAPAWDVARCFWHASQIFRGPFGFSSVRSSLFLLPRFFKPDLQGSFRFFRQVRSSLFLLPRFFIERLSRRGAKAAQERRPLETPGRGDPDGDQVSTNACKTAGASQRRDGSRACGALISTGGTLRGGEEEDDNIHVRRATRGVSEPD